jgi:hypothetical protein
MRIFFQVHVTRSPSRLNRHATDYAIKGLKSNGGVASIIACSKCQCKQSRLHLFQPDFQICEECTLRGKGMLKNKVFQYFADLIKGHSLDQVSPIFIVFIEEIPEDDLDIRPAEYMKLHFLLGSGQMDHSVNAVPIDGNPQPAESFQSLKGT